MIIASILQFSGGALLVWTLVWKNKLDINDEIKRILQPRPIPKKVIKARLLEQDLIVWGFVFFVLGFLVSITEFNWLTSIDNRVKHSNLLKIVVTIVLFAVPYLLALLTSTIRLKNMYDFINSDKNIKPGEIWTVDVSEVKEFPK